MSVSDHSFVVTPAAIAGLARRLRRSSRLPQTDAGTLGLNVDDVTARRVVWNILRKGQMNTSLPWHWLGATCCHGPAACATASLVPVVVPAGLGG